MSDIDNLVAVMEKLAITPTIENFDNVASLIQKMDNITLDDDNDIDNLEKKMYQLKITNQAIILKKDNTEIIRFSFRLPCVLEYKQELKHDQINFINSF